MNVSAYNLQTVGITFLFFSFHSSEHSDLISMGKQVKQILLSFYRQYSDNTIINITTNYYKIILYQKTKIR